MIRNKVCIRFVWLRGSTESDFVTFVNFTLKFNVLPCTNYNFRSPPSVCEKAFPFGGGIPFWTYFYIKWNIIILYINGSFSRTHVIHFICVTYSYCAEFSEFIFSTQNYVYSHLQKIHTVLKIYMYVFSGIWVRLLADSTNVYRNPSSGVKYLSRYICTLWCSKFHCDSALYLIIWSVIVYRNFTPVTLHDR